MPRDCSSTWSADERSGLPSDARLLAEDCEFLSVASAADHRQLGKHVESHYRNANVRVAVTAELLNRLMPKRDPEIERVRDTVLDCPSVDTLDVQRPWPCGCCPISSTCGWRWR